VPPRIAGFTGRENALDSLDAMLMRKRPSAEAQIGRAAAAVGTSLKESARFLGREHVQLELLGPVAPVGKTRRDQHPRAGPTVRAEGRSGLLLSRAHNRELPVQSL
jgi:hypothetical protein